MFFSKINFEPYVKKMTEYMKIILIFLTLIQFINSQNWFDYLKDNQLIAQKSRISNLNGFELLASVYNIDYRYRSI